MSPFTGITCLIAFVTAGCATSLLWDGLPQGQSHVGASQEDKMMTWGLGDAISQNPVLCLGTWGPLGWMGLTAMFSYSGVPLL